MWNLTLQPAGPVLRIRIQAVAESGTRSRRGFLRQRKFVFVQKPPPPLPPPWEYRSSQPAIDWRKCREFQRYNPELNGRSSVADSHSLNLCPDPGCHWIRIRIQTEVFTTKHFFCTETLIQRTLSSKRSLGLNLFLGGRQFWPAWIRIR